VLPPKSSSSGRSWLIRVNARCGRWNRGAVVLLAGLADWDAALLKRAALGVASEWTNRRASELLTDAVSECG
jgi:hypothetical protein